MKIKKGDKVIIRTGKDKGKVSVIEKVLSKKGKIVVTGANIVKKHAKPTEADKKGGMKEVAMPLQPSNVMIVCPSCGKTTRVSYKITNKTKERVCKKCGQSLDKKIEVKEKK